MAAWASFQPDPLNLTLFRYTNVQPALRTLQSTKVFFQMMPRWDWVVHKWGVPLRVLVFHPGSEYRGPALCLEDSN